MLRDWIEGLKAALPGQCAVCHGWPAQPVCEACVVRFAQPQARCTGCALPVPPGITHCGRCLREPPPLERCLAAVSYSYPWSGLVAQFKFHGRPGWAGPLAALMRSAPWVEPALEQADHVLPMPLSRERLAERGFNQALELARALAPAKVRCDLLLRVRNTPAQAELGLAARLRNVKGAFAVEPLRVAQVRARRIVLVDDVMTSGASLFAAADALRQAGAAHITAIVLARTDEPEHPLPPSSSQ
jgi:ComF family protein